MTGAEALPYPPGQPWSVDCTSSQCARLATCLDDLGERLVRRSAGDAAAWQGRAAAAHRTEVGDIAARVPVLPRALTLAARLVRTYAERLVEARRDVDGLRSHYDDQVDAFRRDLALRGDDPGPLGALRARDAERELSAELARLHARHREVLRELVAAERLAAEQLRAATQELRPAVARSRVNEARLDRQVSALQGRRVRTAAQQRRLDNCLVVRRVLRHVRGLRDPVTGAALIAQLLVFEPGRFDGEGRVAVAVGDVDDAGHLAVLVPGAGSNVRSDLRALTGHAVRVRSETRRRSTPATRTAVVAWMGYDSPELSSVASAVAARRGGELLITDLRAFQAGRVMAPHLTVVGHSYGSTTAGMALRRHFTGVDELVLVGSPGSGVDTARDLRVPSGHVFVGAGSRDPVTYLDWFGTDPAHERFGAVRFRAESVTRSPWPLDLAEHGEYFEQGSESLSNIARIVVDDGDAIRAADYRREAWLLPDGIGTDPEADRVPGGLPRQRR